MRQVTYQTVRLDAGRHDSPEEGACVMELASMLAGEPFTDRPHSVSPTIAAFLRVYNDLLDDERRQDLYALASRCVGTADHEGVEAFRTSRLIAWSDEMRRRRPRWSIRKRTVRFLATKQLITPEAAARYAASSFGKPLDEIHAAVTGLVDELIALGSGAQAPDVYDAWLTPIEWPLTSASLSVPPEPARRSERLEDSSRYRPGSRDTRSGRRRRASAPVPPSAAITPAAAWVRLDMPSARGGSE